MNDLSTALQTGRTVLPYEGEPLSIMGEKVIIKLRGDDTGGVYSVIEDETPPLGGPPLHVHSREDETFYVLKGEYEMYVGDATILAYPGTYLFAPRGVPHGFKNVGEQTGRLLVVFSPAGFENFFEEVDAAGNDGPPPFAKVVELAARYGNYVVQHHYEM